MLNIPYHKSEKMFRRYEAHIHTILTNFPNKVTFDPAPLSPNTFMCRLRDAMNSVQEYLWTSPIDLERLKELRPQFECTPINGMVVVHKKGTAALAQAGTVNEISSPQDDFAFELNKPDPKVVVAVAILLDAKVLVKPVKIKNCPRKILTQVADQFDVAISDDTHGYYIMF